MFGGCCSAALYRFSIRNVSVNIYTLTLVYRLHHASQIYMALVRRSVGRLRQKTQIYESTAATWISVHSCWDSVALQLRLYSSYSISIGVFMRWRLQLMDESYSEVAVTVSHSTSQLLAFSLPRTKRVVSDMVKIVCVLSGLFIYKHSIIYDWGRV